MAGPWLFSRGESRFVGMGRERTGGRWNQRSLYCACAVTRDTFFVLPRCWGKLLQEGLAGGKKHLPSLQNAGHEFGFLQALLEIWEGDQRGPI